LVDHGRSMARSDENRRVAVRGDAEGRGGVGPSSRLPLTEISGACFFRWEVLAGGLFVASDDDRLFPPSPAVGGA
jgi:hypothetical protein